MHRSVVFVSALLLLMWTLSASVFAQALSSDSERKLKPKDTFRECGVCPEMIVVPPGSFVMGSPFGERNDAILLLRLTFRNEEPQHTVTIAKQFAVGKFEITLDQFEAFANETGHNVGSECVTYEQGKEEKRSGRSFRNPGYRQDGSHPVACINWHDAKAYVGWLSRKTGKSYRLLTEAEWEYTARAVNTPRSSPRYYFGDDEKEMCRHGNGLDQAAKRTIGGRHYMFFSCDDGYAYTAPVGSFTANTFGLYDIHGNVAEWTEDCDHDNYRGAPTNGSAWTAGVCKYRVPRGGSWRANPWHVRAAARGGFEPHSRYSYIGLRVARALMP